MIYPDEARLGIWKRRSRHGTLQMTSTAPRVRQPHQLNGNQRHMHTQGLGPNLEEAQHAELCKNISRKVVTSNNILMGVSAPTRGTCYDEYTIKNEASTTIELASLRKLNAHSVKYVYAHKFVTTRCTIGNKNTPHNQVLEPGALPVPALSCEET
eukprot:1161225-Pelagomonas_calceolata.AAC.27